ncbi:MAG TPA: M56 family metallopeptidase [Puia sp.]|nr:M56 family metallopeptidase [Puia sp.]
MSALFIYLVKANLLISTLFLFYFLLLKNEKFFRLNRFFILGGLALSMILPLMPASDNFVHPIQQEHGALHNLLAIYSHINIPDTPFLTVDQRTLPQQVSIVDFIKGLSLLQILLCFYGLITAVLLVRFVFQVLRLAAFIKNSEQRPKDGIIYCSTDREIPPFSFFHYLVLNEAQHSSEQIQQIILHEKVHIRQGHTIDLLFSELVSVFLWMNPLVLLLKRHAKLNLEYIADENVLGTGTDKKSYQLSILQSCFRPAAAYPLTNLFNSSKLKLRIKMMNTKRTSNSHLYKYLFVLPLIVATYVVVMPLNARSLQMNTQKINAERKAQKLKAFEGYYTFTFPNDKEPSYIQITAKDSTLILKQIWDGKEITFKQTAPLEFLNQEGELKFPLKFTKDEKGNITQVLAFNTDLWNRAKDYKPPVAKTAIRLSPEQLKTFEGVYGLEERGETHYLQFTATDTGLILKQKWGEEKEIAFRPETELDFFCDAPVFTLKFTKNGEGVITQVLAFNRDLWVRTNK